ncbi:MAG: DUF6913 domain-containing protein, partial [Oceanihabitans sp.]
MILKGLKQKSTKKYIETILNSRQVVAKNNTIESLGVIVNIDEFNDFQAFSRLAQELHVKPNKLKIISFTTQKKETLAIKEACFNTQDIGWKGKLKTIELQEFVASNFDALISYYTLDSLELKLVTAASKAKFKIGVLQCDNRINDF